MDETIGKETSIISLREAMQRYAEVLERSRVKPQSRKNYRGWVERFRSYHREHGGFEVRRCRTGDILRFLGHERSEFQREELEIREAGRAGDRAVSAAGV